MKAPPVAQKNRWRQWVLQGLRRTIPSRRLLVRGPAKAPTVYLTFDDGPDPDTTPRMLEILRRHAVRATFFVVGEKAAAHPELLRRVADEGHAIGGHTYFHRAPDAVNGQQLLDEVRRTDTLFQQILGRPSRLFRPPFGKLTLGKLWRLWAARRTIVLWNKDPKDFAASSAEQLADWFRNAPLAAGDIVLLHDTSAVTAEVLEEVILRTRRAGLSFAPLA